MPVMKRRQMEGPAGGAGLIRYFDVDEGGPKLDPRLVISIVAAIIILEIISTLLLS
ncbi:MAG TPA: preprotein translocase subunit Sec61beta [Candidatus Altiarchaeales archaeon]|nr:preprotein translocase subunit Sec61beta [Candidatus Altiarchaeales archaeon]